MDAPEDLDHQVKERHFLCQVRKILMERSLIYAQGGRLVCVVLGGRREQCMRHEKDSKHLYLCASTQLTTCSPFIPRLLQNLWTRDGKVRFSPVLLGIFENREPDQWSGSQILPNLELDHRFGSKWSGSGSPGV